MQRLEGKIELVTGAARGIGEAIARRFIEEGAVVWLTDIDDDAGKKLAESLGDRARYRRLDVRQEADWVRVLDDVFANDGRLDGLVNNAGITGFENGPVAHDPEHAELADWHAVHRTNIDGVFLGCKHGIRALRRSGGEGTIINISSRSGLVGIPAAAAYASSKAAVRNHSKSVALYCAEQGLGIRCNSIHPAAILTPMWEPMLGEGPLRESNMAAFVADCPMQRFGRPEEVAAVAALLAADEAAYLNGTEINIDGGILAGSAVTPQVIDDA